MILDKYIPVTFRKNYNIDSIAGFFVAIQIGLTTAFIPVIARRLGASGFMISILISTPSLAFFLSPLWIKLTKNINAVEWVSYTSALARLMLLAMYFVTDSVTYIFLIIISTIFSTASSTAYAEVMKCVYPDNYRGRAIGYRNTEIYITVFICSLMAGKLIDLYSYNIIFPVAGFAGIISSLIFCFLRKEVPVNAVKKQNIHIKFSIFEDKIFFYYLIVLSVWALGIIIASPVYPIFYVDVLKESNFHIGIISAIGSLVVIYGYYFWGNFIDSKDLFKGLLICMVCLSIVPVSFLIVNIFKLNIWYLIPMAIINSIGASGLDLISINLVLKLAGKTEKVQQYFSANLIFAGLRGFTGPYIGSFLMKGFGINLTLGVSCLFCLAGIVIFYKMLKYFKNERGGFKPILQ